MLKYLKSNRPVVLNYSPAMGTLKRILEQRYDLTSGLNHSQALCRPQLRILSYGIWKDDATINGRSAGKASKKGIILTILQRSYKNLPAILNLHKIFQLSSNPAKKTRPIQQILSPKNLTILKNPTNLNQAQFQQLSSNSLAILQPSCNNYQPTIPKSDHP